jgi:hypothetical protein
MSRARGTGSLFRRAGCTTWTMQYYVDGRRIREKCETTDYNVAQRMLTRKLYQISQGELVGRERRPARVEELWLSMVNRYKADGRLRAVRDLGTPVMCRASPCRRNCRHRAAGRTSARSLGKCRQGGSPQR